MLVQSEKTAQHVEKRIEQFLHDVNVSDGNYYLVSLIPLCRRYCLASVMKPFKNMLKPWRSRNLKSQRN